MNHRENNGQRNGSETEEAFSRRFISRFSPSGWKHPGWSSRWSGTYSESSCSSHRADFVWGTFSTAFISEVHFKAAEVLQRPQAAKVTQFVRTHRRVSAEDCAERFKTPAIQMRRTINELREVGVLYNSRQGQLMIGDGLPAAKYRSVAIEFKIKNISKAKRQVFAYRAFADRVWLVMPAERRASMMTHMRSCFFRGVGLATFSRDDQVEILQTPGGSRARAVNHLRGQSELLASVAKT